MLRRRLMVITISRHLRFGWCGNYQLSTHSWMNPTRIWESRCPAGLKESPWFRRLARLKYARIKTLLTGAGRCRRMRHIVCIEPDDVISSANCYWDTVVVFEILNRDFNDLRTID